MNSSASVDHIQIEPREYDLDVGQSRDFTARTFDADGNPLRDRRVEWVSDNESVATVYSDPVRGVAQVRAVDSGSATVIATAEGVSVRISLAVRTQSEPRSLSGIRSVTEYISATNKFISAIAGLIVAVVALVGGLFAAGVFENGDDTNNTPTVSPATAIATATTIPQDTTTAEATSETPVADCDRLGPGAFLEECDFTGLLQGVDLSGAKLSSSNFSDTDLTDANLSGADLSYANLDAEMIGVNLTNAILVGSYLSGANLTNADLRSAALTRANLDEVNLSGADLTGAGLTGAILTGVIWFQTTCPDGTMSDDHDSTCVNNLGRPSPDAR